MVDFLNLIIRIFKSHGFEINSTSNYSKYVLATKDNINLSIGYFEPGEHANVGELRNFYRSAKKDNADRLIYILPDTYPGNIDKFADDRNIQLWDRERLEREIGRAVVSDLKRPGTDSDLSSELAGLVASSGTSSEASSTGESVPIMVPVVPLGEDEDAGGANRTETGAALSGPLWDTDASNEPAKDSGNSEYWIVKPKVSKDNASGMANKIVKGFRFNLELVPYYIFNYNCKYDTDEPEEQEESAQGIIGINGLTSNVEDWPEDIDTVKNLDEQHTKLEVKFPFDKALSIAKEAVIELNTKEIETKEEFESTIIFEKKKLKPKPDAIDLSSKGIHYLPVWCIEGSNGLMIIDASSGKIIKEDMFKSSAYNDQEGITPKDL